MNDRSVLLRRAVMGTLALTITQAITPAFAQQSGESQPETRTIETIIVTAQKREQSLQDVPIVVTAVSAQLLQDTGVKDIKDLTHPHARPAGDLHLERVGHHRAYPRHRHGRRQPRPGIFGGRRHRRRLPAAQRRRLRRPGRAGAHRSAERPAGHAVRQEHLGRRHQRRDQAARRSTSAPTSSSRPATTARWKAAASVTGPFARIVAGRLYVASRERDGYLDIDRGPGPRTEDEDVRPQVQDRAWPAAVQPSDALDIRLTADYTDRDENCCAAPQAVPTSPTAGVLAGAERSRARLVRQSRRSVRARRLFEPLHRATSQRQGRVDGSQLGSRCPRRRDAHFDHGVARLGNHQRSGRGLHAPSTSCIAIRTATSATSSNS